MDTLNYNRIPKELVLQAVEDRMNGNRPLTSKAYLQRRIIEIQYDRSVIQKQLETFEKTLWKVKE